MTKTILLGIKIKHLQAMIIAKRLPILAWHCVRIFYRLMHLFEKCVFLLIHIILLGTQIVFVSFRVLYYEVERLIIKILKLWGVDKR